MSRQIRYVALSKYGTWIATASTGGTRMPIIAGAGTPGEHRWVELEESRISARRWAPSRLASETAIVLLHDGLGSVQQWREVPAMLAEATGRCVLAYDRPGHGRSTPIPTTSWPTDWLHAQAGVLAQFLVATDTRCPHLVGHSDGGSIAGIFVADAASRGDDGATSLVMLAAHSWVEERTRVEVGRLVDRRERVVEGLGRFHEHPQALFDAWSSVWVSDEFARWNIGPMLSQIKCPTLVVQGGDDEFATPAHLATIASAVGANAERRLLAGLPHLLHYKAPDVVVEVIASFLARQ